MTKFILSTLLVLFLSKAFTQEVPPLINEEKNKILKVMDLLNLAYVDAVDMDDLTEDAIRAMLKRLDPHSVYIPAKRVKKMNEPLTGNFEGVGIEFNIVDDTIRVVSPIVGGPSEKLGIRSGDKIITINDTVVAGVNFSNRDVIRTLRGKKGTEVSVGIKRGNEKELLDFLITRDKIPIRSVIAAYMARPGVGYIKVNRFSAGTLTELDEALTQLKSENMSSLILDLRDNSGGYLNAAIGMADQFLPARKMIVYTEGRASPRFEAKSTLEGKFETGKLVVLVNEGSASASEIVSGAIQDWDRGVIIGRRTFGKGLVQKPFNLNDGSSIRLTISRYYTPTGRSIQKPYDQGNKEYKSEVYKRFERGELTSIDSISFPDSLRYKTPGGRTVYGGGGIMPDIFVPIDTTKMKKFFRQIVRKGVIHDFVLNYADKNRKKLLKIYPSVEVFMNQFEVDEDLLEDLEKYAKKKKIERDEEETYDDFMFVQLKALLARNLWGAGAFYQIINETSEEYKKAIELIESNKKFEELGVK